MRERERERRGTVPETDGGEEGEDFDRRERHLIAKMNYAEGDR